MIARHRMPRLASRFVLALVVLACTDGGRVPRAAADPVVRPTIAVAAEGSYDSNVYNGRGPDYVTRITPRLALHMFDQHLDLKASYDVGIWLYALERASNSVNHQGRLALEG